MLALAIHAGRAFVMSPQGQVLFEIARRVDRQRIDVTFRCKGCTIHITKEAPWLSS